METIQSREMIAFLRGIQVRADNTVSINILDEDNITTHESRFYEPTYSISVVAQRALHKIDEERIETGELQKNEEAVTVRLLESSLRDKAYNIYVLSQISILEMFAYLHFMEVDPSVFRYLTPQDIQRTRENIRYLADFFGTHSEYESFVADMRELDIGLGYTQNQIPLIRTLRGVNG